MYGNMIEEILRERVSFYMRMSDSCENPRIKENYKVRADAVGILADEFKGR